jgi:hypothetical protein
MYCFVMGCAAEAAVSAESRFAFAVWLRATFLVFRHSGIVDDVLSSPRDHNSSLAAVGGLWIKRISLRLNDSL